MYSVARSRVLPIWIFILTVGLVVNVYPQSAEHDGFWFSPNPADAILRSSMDPSPRVIFSLPHVTAARWETIVPGAVRIGAGGGAQLIAPDSGSKGDYAGGGSLAISGLGNRVVWAGGAAIYGAADRSATRIVGNAGRPVGARTIVGVGVNGTFTRSDSEGGATAVSLDLGVSQRIGAAEGFGSVNLHGALLEIGPESFDRSFVPLLGMEMTVWESGNRSINLGLAAAGRSEEHFRAGVALSFSAGDVLRVGVSTPIVEEGEWFSVLPALRVDAHLPVGRGADTRAGVTVAPTADSGLIAAFDVDTVIASNDTHEPEMRILPSGEVPVSISPRGVYNLMEFIVEATDDRAIASLEITIGDQNGETLRRSVFYPPVPPWGTMDLSQRISYPLRGRRIEGGIVWNPGPEASDGTVRFRADTLDAAGNSTATEFASVDVDGTAPEIETNYLAYDREDVQLDDMRLVPDGRVRGEVRLRGAVRTRFAVEDEASRTVRLLIPERAGAADYLVEWNGIAEDGYRVIDGEYRIVVEATDEAGNNTRVSSPVITVRGIEATMSLSFSRDTLRADSAGSGEIIVANPQLSPLLGLRDWSITLLGSNDRQLRNWSGIDLLPEQIILDDLLFPEDGEYRLSGSAVYLDGHSVETESGTITVDRTPPTISLATDRNRVRRGVDSSIRVFVENGEDAQETEVLLRGAETTIRSESSRRRSPTIDLPLLDEAGRPLSAGRYLIEARSVDQIGNVAKTDPVEIEVLPGEIAAQIATERSLFSPNDDNANDILQIYASVSEERTVDSYMLTVRDDSGEIVVNRSGTSAPPTTIEWDGRDSTGRPVSDGDYVISFDVEYVDGTEITANTVRVAVDTRLDLPEFSISTSVISPDGDERLDSIGVELGTFEDDVFEKSLLLLRGESVVSRRVIEGAAEFSWIPRAEDNRVPADGRYGVALEAVDEAGNRRRSDVLPLDIITRPVSAYLSLSQARLSPNGDDVEDRIAVRPVIPDSRGMTGWSLVITGTTEDRLVRSFRGQGASVPEELWWDGVTETGRSASDGEYLARFTADWEWGARVESESVPFVLDRAPPAVVVNVSGVPFSPDGDGVDDRLRFEIDAQDTSEIQYWYLEISDPQGRFFYDDGGNGAPPRMVVWDGYARNGEHVVSAAEYGWRLETADVLGNADERSGTFETDVLVERTARGYRIQVPGITFHPNSADLILETSVAEGQRNVEVLDRIVEILERYPDYAVIVEGHAVNVSGTEREQRDELLPLSLARARTVMAELVDRGVPTWRLDAEGRGGEAPIVPHSDEENRWKNRRVEFLLVR